MLLSGSLQSKLETPTAAIPAALACFSGDVAIEQSTATVKMPLAWAAIAWRIPCEYRVGSSLPSNSVMFQPSALPADMAASAISAQLAATWPQEITQTLLPAAALGPLAGGAWNVPL